MTKRWNKNFFRKTPKVILGKIKEIDDDIIQIACTKIITENEFEKYNHLNVGAIPLEWVQNSPFHPNVDNGLYSKRNLEGWDIPRPDLPMVTKSWTTEHPNFH